MTTSDLSHARLASRFRAALDGMLDAFLILQPIRNDAGFVEDFLIVEANRAASDLLGAALDDVIGLGLGELFPLSRTSGVFDIYRQVLETGVRFDGEYQWRDPRQRGVWLRLQVVRTDEGLAVTTRDITARKALEDEFVSVVSHELRTPLTSIRGALGLLAAGRLDDAPDRRQRMFDVAISNADRLIRLINDILDVEKMDSGTIELQRVLTDGSEIARQVAEALRPVAERAKVELVVSGETTPTWADVDRITQALTNLVGNAIKFSPPAGTVDIRVVRDGAGAKFEVRDHGRGIPADKLETIFERFQQVDGSDTREKGGTGLGLAISRGIVRQHGGRIWVESALGEGSTFHFTIPRTA